MILPRWRWHAPRSLPEATGIIVAVTLSAGVWLPILAWALQQ